MLKDRLNQNKRTSRLKSPKYREALGRKLRKKRQEKGYSLSDMRDMTTISPKTILEIEKGITINIDYYVEYAKAVEYDFDSLTAIGLTLTPLKELPAEKRERVFLTKKIREQIVESGFLNRGKTTDEIRTHLINKSVVDEKKVTSTDVSGVMRNFVQDETVEVVSKSSGKNTYAIKKTN